MGGQLLWSLAKGSTNCNISLKINIPQSSGRKPSLIAAAPPWHEHCIPREALESYQARWGTIAIVPPPEDFRDNCKLKHHQRDIWLKTHSPAVICKAILDFIIQKNFHCSVTEPLFYNCRSIPLCQRNIGQSFSEGRHWISGLPATSAPWISLRPGIAKEDEGMKCPWWGRGVKMKGSSATVLTLSMDIPWILCRLGPEVTHSCFYPRWPSVLSLGPIWKVILLSKIKVLNLFYPCDRNCTTRKKIQGSVRERDDITAPGSSSWNNKSLNTNFQPQTQIFKKTTLYIL